MRDEIKRERLAKLLGIELKDLPPSSGEKGEDKTREADAVIYYLAKPAAFIKKECGQCGLVFATNQKIVGYCSDACRVRFLASKGIMWDPTKPQTERWGHNLPLTVPPVALTVLDQVGLPESLPQAPSQEASA